jgi:hypothetical protein
MFEYYLCRVHFSTCWCYLAALLLHRAATSERTVLPCCSPTDPKIWPGSCLLASRSPLGSVLHGYPASAGTRLVGARWSALEAQAGGLTGIRAGACTPRQEFRRLRGPFGAAWRRRSSTCALLSTRCVSVSALGQRWECTRGRGEHRKSSAW